MSQKKEGLILLGQFRKASKRRRVVAMVMGRDR